MKSATVAFTLVQNFGVFRKCTASRVSSPAYLQITVFLIPLGKNETCFEATGLGKKALENEINSTSQLERTVTFPCGNVSLSEAQR